MKYELSSTVGMTTSMSNGDVFWTVSENLGIIYLLEPVSSVVRRNKGEHFTHGHGVVPKSFAHYPTFTHTDVDTFAAAAAVASKIKNQVFWVAEHMYGTTSCTATTLQIVEVPSCRFR